MNPELISIIQALNESQLEAKIGDISSLAKLLSHLESLQVAAEGEGEEGLSIPAEQLCEKIKHLIMGNMDDEQDFMQLLKDSIAVMHNSANAGTMPAMEEYPAGLNLTGGNGMETGGGSAGAFAADKELLAEYLTEQRTRLEEIEGYLLTLEKEASDSALGGLRRALHTIKGDSGFLGLSMVAQISHAAESYLDEAEYPLDLEVLFSVKDWLNNAFEDLTTTDGITSETIAGLASVVDSLKAHTPSLNDTQSEAPAPSMDSGAGEGIEAGADAGPGGVDASVTSGATLLHETVGIEEVIVETDESGRVKLTAETSLLVDFITESKEHLDNASTQLLSLESTPDDEEAMNSVFRAFHTIKGIAGFLNLGEIAVLAHDTENLLDQVRRKELDLSPGLIDLVFEALDWMGRLIGNVSEGLSADGMVSAEPELKNILARIKSAQSRTEVKAPPPADLMPENGDGEVEELEEPEESEIRPLGEILVTSGAVSSTELDEALDEEENHPTGKKLGEVLVEKKVVTPSEVHKALKQQKEDKGMRKAVELKETIRVDYDRLEGLVDAVGELVLAEAMISQDDDILGIHSEGLANKLHNLRQVSRKLQEMGTAIRMVPISGTFQKMARLVRDLSRKSGKPINFNSSGDETELDRAYVDQIADPLVHMIRNSMDHGVEPPEDRLKAGKTESGNINLRAFHEGGNIHVEVSDDGRGLDSQKILSKARERGLVSANEELSEHEIYQLIFEPGFSTASVVTEVSGRGVGMDVVRRNISELRGQVSITSELGKGTRFRISLPLTLALIDGMLVKVGSERFIIPVLSVVESTRPTKKMVSSVVGKGEMVSLRDRQIPLYRMYNILGIEGAKQEPENALLVIVEHEAKLMGIMVDELIGMQQTVIKSLGGGFMDAKGFSGSTIMSDGRVGLIIDIAGLLSMAKEGIGSERRRRSL